MCCTELKKEYMLKLDKYLEKLTAEQEKIISSSNNKVLQMSKNSVNSAAEEPNPDRTSDSEDDNIEFSSSSEEGENYIHFNEDETEEEEDEDEVVQLY